MESHVFNRKNLLGFSMVVLFYHLAMTLVPWLVYSWPMFIADYVLLGLAASGWLLYWGWNRVFAKPKPVMIILIGFLVWLLISCIVMTVKWDNDWVGYTVNEKNQAIKIEYLLNGEPTFTTDGVSVINREYDDKGLVAVESYLYRTWDSIVVFQRQERGHLQVAGQMDQS